MYELSVEGRTYRVSVFCSLVTSMDSLRGWTEDGLFLQGVFYESDLKDYCIVFIHGMWWNSIENYFAEVLGKEFSQNGYGFIYGHNRWYSHINDIKTSLISKDWSNTTKRIGVMYERFEECVFDIDLRIDEAKKLWYNNIVLLWHSLWCNKVIHYLYKKKSNGVSKNSHSEIFLIWLLAFFCIYIIQHYTIVL